MHLDEHTIELYVIGAESVKTRRKEIARHLRQCKGCFALHAEIEAYYSQVEGLKREQAGRPAHALYAPETALRRRSTEQTTPFSPLPRTLSQRFAESFRHYPLRWSAGFALVAAALVLFVPTFSAKDLNPAYAKAIDENLVAFNAQGKELWKKRFDPSLEEGRGWDPPTNMFPVIDVNRDGQNEILSVFGWANWYSRLLQPWLRVVMCFNADGSERWRYELHRNISVNGVPFSDDYRVYQILPDDLVVSANPDVIAMASHVPWFPNVVFRLEANSGKLLGEYWHHGMLPLVDRHDIDGDGIREVFLGGQNNRFQQACVVALDPRELRGQAPTPPEFSIDGVSPGSEMFYMVFPSSDLKPYWMDITNEVTRLQWKADSTLEVVVRERITAALREKAKAAEIEDGTIYFYFDRSMRCTQVRVSDAFSAIRAKYRFLGIVKGDIDNAYLEKLRQGVRYWDGEQFVSEPVMNKRFEETRGELSQIQ